MKIISNRQYEAYEAAVKALEETQGLLTAMLLEQRPKSEIEAQIAENDTALRAAGIQIEGNS